MRSYSVVFACEAHASLLGAGLPRPCVCVRSSAELTSEIREIRKRYGAPIVFVDVDLLGQLGRDLANVPIVAIANDATSRSLPNAIESLASFPWLGHLISATMLSGPLAQAQLGQLVDELAHGEGPALLDASGHGRLARIATASRRDARFTRMAEFFARYGLSAKACDAILDVSEELVMNALYDAPMEAGYFDRAVQRTDNVELPPERACEISYGIDGARAFVRVRDTFGALTRARLVDVLKRCNSKDVALDTTRGGAGLGLWRVFSAASTVAITVVPDKVTDFVVGFATSNGRLIRQLLAVSLIFAHDDEPPTSSMFVEDTRDLFDRSVTLLHGA